MKLHFLLTEEDGDIIFWKESLPHFYFSGYVRDILRAERRRKYAFLPVPDKQGFLKKRVDTKLYLLEKEEIETVMSFPRGNRTRIIKKLIRKHLRANYERAKAEKPEEEVKETIESATATQTEIADLNESKDEKKITVSEEVADDEMSDEYRKMLSQMSRRKFS